MIHYDLSDEEMEVFVQEMGEILDSLEGDLSLLEQGTRPEIVQRVFRAFHTMKGSAASVGHHTMAQLTHRAEAVLTQIRDGALALTPEKLTVLFEVADALRHYLDDVIADRPPGPEATSLLRQLGGWVESPTAHSELQTAPQGVPLPALSTEARQLLAEALAAGQHLLLVQIQADPAGFAPGARLFQAHVELGEMARVVASQPDAEALAQGQAGPDYRALAVTELAAGDVHTRLQTIDGLQNVRVSDISGMGPGLAAAPSPAESSPQAERTSSGESHRPTGAVDLRRDTRFVRTRVERLDNLLNLTGELVTDRNRLFRIYEELAQWLRPEQLQALNDTLAHLSTVTDRLHEEVVAVRMQPIGALFGRMPRIVRQIARELGKEVELNLSGQETEVDRSVIEHVADPLLHLIRNAIDHGIEPPEERVALGKPPVGRLTLQASSADNQIVIMVSDDGRGIDAERVREKAVALGLLSPDKAQDLSYDQSIELIFTPGLTTTARVSEISGRGVGMDVVRSNLQRLNGAVTVRSSPGQGTTFELRMPLTLAILPALLAQVDRYVYAIPLQNVVEILKRESLTLSDVRGRPAAYVRGEFLPLYEMDDLLGQAPAPALGAEMAAASPPSPPKGRPYVVSIVYRDVHFGVWIDRPLGKEEVVLKALRYPLNRIDGLAGATLLGDGRIGLIVDVGGIGARLTPLPQPVSAHSV